MVSPEHEPASYLPFAHFVQRFRLHQSVVVALAGSRPNGGKDFCGAASHLRFDRQRYAKRSHRHPW
jgi:hypothetical protein